MFEDAAKKSTFVLFVLLALLAFGCAGKATTVGPAMPDEWIETRTGHRVMRLSESDVSSQTFYFHQNCFTESGDLLVYTGYTPEGRSAFAVDLRERTIRRIATNVGFEVVAPKRR